MSAANLYEAPKAPVADVPQASFEAENLRKLHVSHEASIKSVGLLYIFGGLMLLFVGVVTMVAMLAGSMESGPWVGLYGFFLLALGIGYSWSGMGLRRLSTWARKPAAGLACLGLLAFPAGTLINGYILWLFLSAKGRMIFSSEYAEIVRITPHIKHRTSIIVWIFVVLLVVVLGVAAYSSTR
jgi:hypothetical protein